jgi:pyruvate/2-oxoglutarate dehydrogenase complex dihydrolipoamide acyltransferase (E2) component
LAGIAYLHWSDSHGPAGPGDHSDVFERREGTAGPLKPSQTVVPNVMSASGANAGKAPSSLDFIRAGDDFRAATAPPPAASTAAAAAAPAAAAPAAAPSPSAKKPAASAAASKKNFTMPKLQPTRGFTNFGAGTALPAPGAAAPAAASGGGQNMQQMLQNLPPGAQNNPDLQKYLQSQQGQQSK